MGNDLDDPDSPVGTPPGGLTLSSAVAPAINMGNLALDQAMDLAVSINSMDVVGLQATQSVNLSRAVELAMQALEIAAQHLNPHALISHVQGPRVQTIEDVHVRGFKVPGRGSVTAVDDETLTTNTEEMEDAALGKAIALNVAIAALALGQNVSIYSGNLAATFSVNGPVGTTQGNVYSGRGDDPAPTTSDPTADSAPPGPGGPTSDDGTAW